MKPTPTGRHARVFRAKLRVMTSEERRASIIAAEAERSANTSPPLEGRDKPRSNWAASPPVRPRRRMFFRRGPKAGADT